MTTRPTIEVLADHRDVLGEAPWWDAATETLHWVDITARGVRSATLAEGVVNAMPTPSEPGFVVKMHSGRLIAGCRDGLYCTDDGMGTSWRRRWQGSWDASALRVNDGKTDRQGRLWFGTVHEAETDACAELYHLRPEDPLPHSVLDGICVSNGLGWSPDGRIMYYTDSASHTIVAFDFDTATGYLGTGQVFATDPNTHEPDGLTVDVDGCVWSAKWDGGKVVRYTPNGRVDREIALPVSRPTSCMFVGSDLRTLAITSAARVGVDDDSLGGAVFLVAAGAQGLPELPADVR